MSKANRKEYACRLDFTFHCGYSFQGEKKAEVFGFVEADSFSSAKILAELKMKQMLRDNQDIKGCTISGPYLIERKSAKYVSLPTNGL